MVRTARGMSVHAGRNSSSRGTESEKKKLEKSSLVMSCPLDSEVGDRRVLFQLSSMLDREPHPLQDVLSAGQQVQRQTDFYVS